MNDGAAPIPPLVVELEVAVEPAAAFDAWVSRPSAWWPRGHTMSGDPATIVVEPFRGGRIYERDRAGNELAWGEVLECEPPRRLRFAWHLFFPRAEATEVELTFEPVAGGTRVRLVQTGWEVLGEPGAPRRDRTVQGWAAVTAPYRDLLAEA